MKQIFTLFFIFNAFVLSSQDALFDLSYVHESCKHNEHLLRLFTINGVPQHQNLDDTLIILVNNGYCLGFSKKYNQPLWAAYQVSKSRKEVDYERFPFFADDVRLPLAHQIGTETFGGGYDRGHLVPNSAINKQYGKTSQMETFLMSNISPQKAELNQGVWQKLEAEIPGRYCSRSNSFPHVWVIVGPVFSQTPDTLHRKNGLKVPVPESFFCILSRPDSNPWTTPVIDHYLSFLIPQNVLRNQKLDESLIISIDEIEALTNLNFFSDFTPYYQNKLESDKPTSVW
ncbi:MAG: DNA/RNA non-specific endonuclease [Bacteroidales bacterium]|nr:DNA/RNA non-specific endonuclease [Bacteroidales bacterium]